jgi:predicted aminopeptidase
VASRYTAPRKHKDKFISITIVNYPESRPNYPTPRKDAQDRFHELVTLDRECIKYESQTRTRGWNQDVDMKELG